MKLLICSDSHGVARAMIAAVEKHAPDMLLFLGDGLRDLEPLRHRFPQLPVVAVRGNCDLIAREPEQCVLELAGARILMAHGHRYGVKRDLALFSRHARDCGAQIALFGHTHRAFCLEAQDLVLFNPGSAGDALCPSCGLLELDGKERSFRHITGG